jgi:hypothetical protein
VTAPSLPGPSTPGPVTATPGSDDASSAALQPDPPATGSGGGPWAPMIALGTLLLLLLAGFAMSRRSSGRHRSTDDSG